MNWKWRLIVISIFMGGHFYTHVFAQEIQLKTTRVLYHQVEQRFVIDGVVEAVKQATMSAQTSGQVLEVNFDVGDFVKKGDVLARFKSVQQEASLGQSEAQLIEVTAVLKSAQKEFERIKELYAKQVISAAQFDKTKADLEVAQARLESTKAGMSQSVEQVEYTVIHAPYSGIVLERHIEPGEIAAPGSPIMAGFSPDNLRVIVTVPQNDVVTIKKYSNAKIILNEGEEQRYLTGGKITIARYADPKTHTFRIQIDLPANTGEVYPGMLVKVAFMTGQTKKLLIPASAVAYRSEVRAIYVINEKNQISMRHVRLGDISQNMIEVLSGLEPEEKIAINPVNAAIALKSQRANAAPSQTSNH
ncbi:MAG: hypothetical protein BWK79_19535 [Beggiatoa sp. IS2]|nr:MAG: hypothetical protein BWK79_19535 [Beggiatoa sp. IS2]